MTIWTKRNSGTNTVYPVYWTTATRPSSPYVSQTGLNTDHDGLETYNGTAWLILNGQWTTTTRPATANLAVGSCGINTDAGMGFEMWNGTEWQLL